MDIKKIERRQKNIDDKYINIYGKNITQDGILNLKKYLDSPLKILWILKEIYDEVGYNQREVLNKMAHNVIQSNSLEKSNRKDWYRTLDPIIYTSYQILNNFKQYNDIDYIRNDISIIESLQQIALINVKKHPGDSRAINNEISDWYNKTKNILKEQIELINPNVIIGGNVLKYFKNDFELEFQASYPISYIKKNNILWIDAYHPNQTQVKRDLYCDSITNCVKIQL